MKQDLRIRKGYNNGQKRKDFKSCSESIHSTQNEQRYFAEKVNLVLQRGVSLLLPKYHMT
jgi:hypothetical protein